MNEYLIRTVANCYGSMQMTHSHETSKESLLLWTYSLFYSSHGPCNFQHVHHLYRSVPQIRPPPCVFRTKSCWGIFIPRISPQPQKKTHTHPTVEILFKPLGCLPLKCLPRTWTARIKDGHASYRREHLSASRSATPCAWPSPYPPPTMTSCPEGRV